MITIMSEEIHPNERHHLVFLPTRAEIEESCRMIREEWSEEEHRRRARYEAGAKRVDIREINARELFGEN